MKPTKSKRFKKLFPKDCSVIGMIHLLPMPGTPLYKGSVAQIIDTALQEAQIYKDAGIDAIMIENIHDIPYLNRN